MKVFMTNETLSLSSIAATCGVKLIEAKGFEAKRQTCLEAVNAGVIQLHKAKAKVGQNNKCAIATAFFDALVTGGLGKGTAANYLSTFRKAVTEGKPVTEWNPAQSKGKGKGKGGAKATAAKELADKLATAYRDADFEGFMNDLQASYENDEVKTLLEGIQSYLEAAGIKLK
jgi:hypothetical protein